MATTVLPEPRPRILVCAKGYPPDMGGVQTYGEHVVRAYLAAGYQPVVISSRPGPRGWIDLAYPEGSVRLWNVGEGHQALLFVRMLAAARRIVRRHSFVFHHATTWRAAAAIAPWRRRTQEPMNPPWCQRHSEKQ